MKILILGFSKLKVMPYLNFYLNAIDKEKNEVHVIYWNRDLRDEDISNFQGVKLFEFRRDMLDSAPFLEKIKKFFYYRKFVKEILKINNYDLFISLYPHPGLTIFDLLFFKFKKRYILDFRDVSIEFNSFFRFLVGKLAQNAIAVFVSSEAFCEYLPKKDINIYLSHNMLVDSLKHRDIRNEESLNKVIRISYWGLVRHIALNKIIIGKLANDNRFELHFYGKEPKSDLRDFARSIGAKNVFFHGEYQPKERYDFVRKTDMLHNVFDDRNMRMAVSNKYYDGIIFRIPQICFINSHMGNLCKVHKIGLPVDPYSDEFADILYKYYRFLDRKDFCNKCDIELNRVLNEYDHGHEFLSKLFNS